MRKTYVLDTNVLLNDPNAIYSFENNEILIPSTVLDELDNLKDRKGRYDITKDARAAIRNLEAAIKDFPVNQLSNGIPLHGGGVVRFVPCDDVGSPDDRIIKCASKEKATLITNDINMRLKAASQGVTAQPHHKSQLIDDADFLPTGIEVVNNDKLLEIQNNQYIYDTKDYYNHCYLTASNQSALHACGGKAQWIRKSYSVFGITTRNLEQSVAAHSLTNPDVPLVILTGAAGTGKTLLALAAALEQKIEQRSYDKIIVSRSAVSLDADIGFLPGSEEEKMAPWLSGFTDNLEVITDDWQSDKKGNSYQKIQYLKDLGNIQFKSLNYIRGRSIQNAFVIIDEAQNLTCHQLKTIITRIGASSKLVLIGNLAQIDNPTLTPLTSGLSHVSNKSRDSELVSCIHLKSIERSALSEWGENVL